MAYKANIKKKPTKAAEKLKKILSEMKGDGKLKVGLPKGSNAYPDGTSVIMVGHVHEFGSSKMNIPERSFLRSTLQQNRNKYKQTMRSLGKKILTGSLGGDAAVSMLGLQVTADVKDKITDIKDPANTEGTKAAKGSSNPLIDSGHLRQSVTWEKS